MQMMREMRTEARKKRKLKTDKNPLTAKDGADIIISVTGDDIRNGEIPGVFASRLIFSYIFTTGARKLVRGCHAPVL